MQERIDRLENELRVMVQCVRDLEARLAVLEARAPSNKAEAVELDSVSAASGEGAVSSAQGWADTRSLLPCAGRLFIVMGGAYLLRAFTEASTFSAAAGVSLGLIYALVWAAAAGRAAAQGYLWNGLFHGVAAALIAYPLIWESATRFKILQPPMDAWLLAGLAAVFFAVACKYRFQALAWLANAGSILTVLALLLATESYVYCTAFLILLGAATLWMGYELEWRGLRWLAALAANLAVFGLTVRALAAEPKESAAAALAIQLLLLGVYFASVAIRTLIRARNVIPFEVVQIITAFMLGFVGAVYTSRATGYGTALLGYAGLLLGAACYAVAFAFVDKRIGRGRNFYFYASLALLFSLTGSGLLLSGAALSLAWASLAVLMGWLGWRYARQALTAHSTICVLASAFASGLVAYTAQAFIGPAELAGGFPDAAQLFALLGAALCMAVPFPDQPEGGARWLRLQRLMITIALVGGLGGAAVSLLGKTLGNLPQGGLDPGILATDRTVILALAVLLVAWVGKHARFAEWAWLAYPILFATGVKIVFEDLPRSRPATLFLALAIYGCALILSPRIRRSG